MDWVGLGRAGPASNQAWVGFKFGYVGLSPESDFSAMV